MRTLAPGLGEIKRMWIEPGHRGRGLGSQLLGALEAASLELGHERVRLDTNGALREAIRLYAARGYRPIDRYNDDPDATHFFENISARDPLTGSKNRDQCDRLGRGDASSSAKTNRPCDRRRNARR